MKSGFDNGFHSIPKCRVPNELSGNIRKNPGNLLFSPMVMRIRMAQQTCWDIPRVPDREWGEQNIGMTVESLIIARTQVEQSLVLSR